MRRLLPVAQGTDPFHGTIEDNLRLGRPDATEADLVAAAALRTPMSSSDALPDEPLNRESASVGAPPSGGQRQRIAIARALLRNTTNE